MVQFCGIPNLYHFLIVRPLNGFTAIVKVNCSHLNGLELFIYFFFFGNASSNIFHNLRPIIVVGTHMSGEDFFFLPISAHGTVHQSFRSGDASSVRP